MEKTYSEMVKQSLGPPKRKHRPILKLAQVQFKEDAVQPQLATAVTETKEEVQYNLFESQPVVEPWLKRCFEIQMENLPHKAAMASKSPSMSLALEVLCSELAFVSNNSF